MSSWEVTGEPGTKVLRRTCDGCGIVNVQREPNVEVGEWRVVPNPRRSHGDPLADSMVSFCSRECGEPWFSEFVNSLWPQP